MRGPKEPVIILPGQDQERDAFSYGMLMDMGGKRPIGVFMMKWPEAMDKSFGTIVKDEEEIAAVAWCLLNRTDESADGIEFSRYEFHALPITHDFEPIKSLEDLQTRDTRKDGYVYIPKLSRDGKHADFYMIANIKEDMFRTRTTRGMYEEVAWSPFGSVQEAVKQEGTNLERNPLMRHWH